MIDFVSAEEAAALLASNLTNEERQLVIGAMTMQRREGLSDAAFARRVEIAQPTWHNIRRGKRHPGLDFVRGLASAYPLLRPEIEAFLRSGKH